MDMKFADVEKLDDVIAELNLRFGSKLKQSHGPE
jgi:hypothetical protein